jgi:hypothetical protein
MGEAIPITLLLMAMGFASLYPSYVFNTARAYQRREIAKVCRPQGAAAR